MEKKKHKNPKRFKEVKVRVITFTAKTFKALQMAYIALRQRYRRKVVLNATPIGAGLLSGNFTIA